MHKATPTKKSLESTGRLIATVVLTLVPFAAAAQSTGVLATKRPITWGMIFALLFLMLGPIKLLGPFAAATKECDRVFRLRLATRAFLFSAAAVTIAGALGEQMLDNFAIPVLVLQIAGLFISFCSWTGSLCSSHTSLSAGSARCCCFSA